MDWRNRAVLFLVAIVMAFAARLAAADPVTVPWVNTAPPGMTPATKALLCVGQFCSLQTTYCQPGERCETEHNLPPGEYDDAYLMISAPEAGYTWSVPIEGTLVVDPVSQGGTCQHDSNGDGVVSTADFGTFWSEFRNGCGE